MLIDALRSFRRSLGLPPRTSVRRRRWSNRPHAACERLEDRTLLSAFAVNTTDDAVDVNPGDGFAEDAQGRTTLRAAVMEANALAGSDSISLGAGVYSLSIEGRGENDSATGDLDILSDITIVGAGSDQTTINGNQIDRLFDVHDGRQFDLTGVEGTGGRAYGNGTTSAADEGGAIRMDFFTEVTIEKCVFRDNAADSSDYASGGAIQSFGSLTIDDSLFENNFSSNDGGAISAVRQSASTTIRNTTFVSNTAPGGAGIFNHSQLRIENCTFVGNTDGSFDSGDGGAINNNTGDLILINSTISGNVAGAGGGLYNGGTAIIRNCTIVNNIGEFGGGIWNNYERGTVTLENSIVALNTAEFLGPDIYHAVKSLGHNLIGDTADTSGFVATDLLNVDPRIASLADNGGPTWTHALMTSSPAIDAANTATAPPADQRGVTRPQGMAADIGAFELKPVVNEPPVALNDSVTTDEDESVFLFVRENDTDADGDTLTIVSVSEPAGGTAEIVNNGTSIIFRPDANFNGTTRLLYTISDGNGGTDTALATIIVNAVNDPPVANRGGFGTNEDTPLTDVLTATDAEGETLTYSVARQPRHGTVAIQDDGTFTYTPEANYNYIDSFGFWVTDGTTRDFGEVTISINAVDDAPVAADDQYDVDEGGTLTRIATGITFLDLVSEPGDYIGQGQTYYFSTSDGSFTKYDLHNDNSFHLVYFGHGDSVSIEMLAPFNELFVPGTYTGATRYPFQNAEDPGLTVTMDSRGSNNITGQFTIYQAIYDANGELVNFLANFEQHSEGADPALFGRVEYNAVANPNAGVLANDTELDGEKLTATLVDNVAHGALTFNADGTFSYTPEEGYSGTDSFTYQLSDGITVSNTATVTINIHAANDAPVATADTVATNEDTPVSGNVLANDRDAEGDSLTATLVNGPASGDLTFNADGSFTYTPDANFHGSDSFTYEVSDGNGGTDTAIVAITVSAFNDAPVANDDSAISDEDTAVTIDVLANDTDLDGDSLSVVDPQRGPANGTLEVNSDGTVTYTPNANFHGTDSFTYLTNDGQAASNIATVTITVSSKNDAPTAGDLTAAGSEDQPITGTLSGEDIDGDDLTYEIVGQPANGVVSINATSGEFTYTPAAGFVGTDTFTYQVSDGTASSNTATVTITIAPMRDTLVVTFDPLAKRTDNVHTLGRRSNSISTVIYGSESLDVRDIDLRSLRLTIDGVEYSADARRNGRLRYDYRDLNRDGIQDLVIRFDLDDARPTDGPTAATLSGELDNGTAFSGVNEVTLESKQRGKDRWDDDSDRDKDERDDDDERGNGNGKWWNRNDDDSDDDDERDDDDEWDWEDWRNEGRDWRDELTSRLLFSILQRLNGHS